VRSNDLRESTDDYIKAVDLPSLILLAHSSVKIILANDRVLAKGNLSKIAADSFGVIRPPIFSGQRESN
jgi:hypothetical protein